jgi:hypothetical protein
VLEAPTYSGTAGTNGANSTSWRPRQRVPIKILLLALNAPLPTLSQLQMPIAPPWINGFRKTDQKWTISLKRNLVRGNNLKDLKMVFLWKGVSVGYVGSI